MDYKLKHITLQCDNLDRCVDYQCNVLRNSLCGRFSNSDYDVAYVGAGTDIMLEMVGKPYSPEINEKCGNIQCMGLETTDVDEAFGEIKAKGVEVIYAPVDTPLTREFAIRDAIGLPVKIFKYKEGHEIANINSTIMPAKDEDDLMLHHVSMLTYGAEYEKQVEFYEDVLGFQTVTVFPENAGVVGGFAFLTDPYFDSEVHNVMFELISTPDYERCKREKIDYSHAGSDPREIIFLEKYGPYYDHYCYTASSAKPAYEKALVAGAIQDRNDAYAPCVEFGCFISWVKDASGNDIEIMDALADEDVEDLMDVEEVYVIKEKELPI